MLPTSLERACHQTSSTVSRRRRRQTTDDRHQHLRHFNRCHGNRCWKQADQCLQHAEDVGSEVWVREDRQFATLPKCYLFPPGVFGRNSGIFLRTVPASDVSIPWSVTLMTLSQSGAPVVNVHQSSSSILFAQRRHHLVGVDLQWCSPNILPHLTGRLHILSLPSSFVCNLTITLLKRAPGRKLGPQNPG